MAGNIHHVGLSRWRLQLGTSEPNVIALLGVDAGQAEMAGTDRAAVLLFPDRCFVTDGESSAVVRHAISAVMIGRLTVR